MFENAHALRAAVCELLICAPTRPRALPGQREPVAAWALVELEILLARRRFICLLAQRAEFSWTAAVELPRGAVALRR